MKMVSMKGGGVFVCFFFASKNSFVTKGYLFHQKARWILFIPFVSNSEVYRFMQNNIGPWTEPCETS